MRQARYTFITVDLTLLAAFSPFETSMRPFLSMDLPQNVSQSLYCGVREQQAC